MNKKIITLTATALALVSMTSNAQKIDRRPIVERNSPTINNVDTLSSFSVGNGHFAVTVDATGLQTFPEYYRNGVPLGTFSEWGWHSFPNTGDYKPEEALKNHDFHRGHEEPYSSEFRQKGRQCDASNYLRANPHRMHLGCLGFDFGATPTLSGVRQKLDMWSGTVTSDFDNRGFHYHVVTVCHPTEDIIAVKINRKKIAAGKGKDKGEPMKLKFRFPYPTGKHSDDGCDWTYNPERQSIVMTDNDANGDVLKIKNDTNIYYTSIAWRTDGRKAQCSSALQGNELSITLPETAEVIYQFAPKKTDQLDLTKLSFTDVAKASADYWENYWNEGGIVDFSRVADKRARELERRVVLSQYLLAVNDAQKYPPAETGLTYNSWFGKFHLEMIYWHQAWQALWGHPEALERTLDWYFSAEPMAREIARRQGFKGVRWMKMTDPSAAEAPSNVGSYLIWQQPHLIYLAELLYRATGSDSILRRYAPLVDETAEFMADFAEYDSLNDQYILRGYIPAQETLKADSVRNSPFELSYWLTTLRMAQQWRQRLGKKPVELWNDIIEKLAPLPSQDGIYTVSEGVPLLTKRAQQTDNPVGIDKFASDHPMPLGALGMLPDSRLFTKENMSRTFDWIQKYWNWQKTWGWDYPMVSMCAVRLGRPDDAVNAILMPVAKNTYLNNGHNWQTDRLRCYLPGNGGLLTTVALMCAGWDGCNEHNPGFPKSWDVRWEGLKPLP
ncbi:MAG: hypothetical protein PUG12_04940 [Prevotella sp.]|nr:hypothetical protein [Prevotella sp.]